MAEKMKLFHALCVGLALVAAEAVAETDYAWRFDTSGRAALITVPSETAENNSTVLEYPAWTEETCNGIKTPGLYFIVR